MFQNFNRFAHRSALDNVARGPRRVLGLSPDAARERARTELARVHLQHPMEKRPSQLSGGQQQRVAIARALTMQPEQISDTPAMGRTQRVLAHLHGEKRQG